MQFGRKPKLLAECGCLAMASQRAPGNRCTLDAHSGPCVWPLENGGLLFPMGFWMEVVREGEVCSLVDCSPSGAAR
jgi:hypothetical protein